MLALIAGLKVTYPKMHFTIQTATLNGDVVHGMSADQPQEIKPRYVLSESIGRKPRPKSRGLGLCLIFITNHFAASADQQKWLQKQWTSNELQNHQNEKRQVFYPTEVPMVMDDC